MPAPGARSWARSSPAAAAVSPRLRGRPRPRSLHGEGHANPAPPVASSILLDSNENPLGPGPAAMEALTRAFADAGPLPTNARTATADLRAAIARRVSVTPENVALGARILGAPAHDRSPLHLVRPPPGHRGAHVRAAGQDGRAARHRRAPRARGQGRPARSRRDGQAARWAGSSYLCNPNNPTSTVHPAPAIAEFVARVGKESPETTILIDEAYHDYVDRSRLRHRGAPRPGAPNVS